MKFSANWLREWFNTDADITTWCEKLTAAGLEVEELLPLGTQLKNVCIGEVLSATRHPNADRLNICQVRVDTKSDQHLTIVCGASNVRSGLKVAVAQVGAVLPGNVQIKQTKIRGVESCGMICSSTELGLGEINAGIMELSADAPIGTTFIEYFGLPDHLLDINLTPNRGDCLSVLGLARELSAVTHWPMIASPTKETTATSSSTLPIKIEAVAECPSYLGRIVQDIRTDAQTPLWMQERLRRSNIRPIHPVVDVMNYVMLELGQPLHAFDLSTIQEGIIVRHSRPNESVALLNGQTITLEKPALVIADAEKILALAGIMGDANSGVTTTTTSILIECAFFTPDAIRPTLRTLNIQSDAAHRFERGVDPNLQLRAMHRATELVLEICGGKGGEVIDITHPSHLPTAKKISLRSSRIKRVLGIDLSIETIEQLLQRLHFQTTRNDLSGSPNMSSPENSASTVWNVTTPTYRFDIALEIDLIEEIARIYGYTNIQAQSPNAALVMQPMPEKKLCLSRICDYFTHRGYHETVNYSFVEPKLAKLFDPINQGLFLKNPISTDLAVMRTSLWPGLIQSALFNLNRQQSNIRFFEKGICFLPKENEVIHQSRMAGMVIGHTFSMQWGLSKQSLDFFDIKGDLENLFSLTKDNAFTFAAGNHPALHPGRSSEILRGEKNIGHVGELHPELQQLLDLPMPVYLFELNLSDLLPATLPSYTNPSKYPSIKRDLAFVIDETIPYEIIKKTAEENAGETLQTLQLFDIYRGTGIPDNQKSLALSLTFQLDSGTLTDNDVDVAIEGVVAGLGTRFKAVLRK